MGGLAFTALFGEPQLGVDLGTHGVLDPGAGKVRQRLDCHCSALAVVAIPGSLCGCSDGSPGTVGTGPPPTDPVTLLACRHPRTGRQRRCGRCTGCPCSLPRAGASCLARTVFPDVSTFDTTGWSRTTDQPRAATGQWSTGPPSGESAVDLAGLSDRSFRCPRCGRFATRGGGHRCPTPGLVALTPAAATIVDACRDAGGTPLVVGGSVRDALLGETLSKDVDLEVHGVSAEDLLTALLATGGRVDEVGASFGVIKVTFDGEDFDVSLPRRDSKTGAGHRGFQVHLDGDLTAEPVNLVGSVAGLDR